MALLLQLTLLSSAANAQGLIEGKRLIEVTFSIDDKAPTEQGHTIATLWISDKRRGRQHEIYNWSIRGTSSQDIDAQRKVADCLEILRRLTEPESLPSSENDILTLRYIDESKPIIKRFSVNEVPPDVRLILNTMGFLDDAFPQFKFVKK